MKISSGIFIVAILLVLGLITFQPAEKLFLAAVSNANVFVTGTQENNPPPVVSSGGGGFYYPTVITPTVPPEQKPTPPIVKQPEQPNIAENPAQPVESPVAISENTQQPPTITSLLPLAVADLSARIPAFANILSNLNVKNSQDVANLQNYDIFLPGLKSITGAMPSDTVFVLLGNKNIDAATKLNFSESAPAIEEVNVLTAKPMQLVVKPSAPIKDVTGYVLFDNFSVLKFNYKDNNDGTYVADINSPAVAGQYQIITSINYADANLAPKEIKTTTLVDPDGYIYEKVGNGEFRINGASVALYKLNTKKQYELWNANEYGQENPQTTNSTGNYSFLVPVGTYYLTVNAPGYYPYKSDAVSVMEGKEIHTNIALKKELDLSSLLNWNTILIFILFCMVIYNFYMDMQRRKR